MERRGIVIDLDDLHEAWPELLQRANLNVLGLHNWGDKGTLQEKLDRLIAFANGPEGKKLQEDLRSKGVHVEYELHSMSWLLPREHYRRHPEWFRMDENGERTPEDNFCPSNQEALAVIQENSVKLANLLPPSSDRFYFWQDDNTPWCKCGSCREFSSSDQTLLVNNAILAALRSVRGDAKLAYLAYTHTLEEPPVRVKPLEGTFLEIAGPIIHKMERARFEAALDRNLACFGVEHAQVLEYWLDVSFFNGWQRPAQRLEWDAAQVKRDIDFYRSKGFKSVTSFGVFLDRGYFMEYGEPPVVEYGKLLK